MARTKNLLGADAAGIPPVLSPSSAGLDSLNVLRQRAAGQQAAPPAAAAAPARPILPSASSATSFGAGNTARSSDATSGSLGGEFLDEGTSLFLSPSRVPGGGFAGGSFRRASHGLVGFCGPSGGGGGRFGSRGGTGDGFVGGGYPCGQIRRRAGVAPPWSVFRLKWPPR